MDCSPLAGGAGMFIAAIFAGRQDIPTLCEDCPRVETEDPIREKYGTRKEGTKNKPPGPNDRTD